MVWLSKLFYARSLATIVMEFSIMFDFIQNLFKTTPTAYLRPPGARDENELVATCIKCGRCVEVCPYQSIFFAPYSLWHLYGTPLIDSLKQPCYLCMKCPAVCPTGSLKPVAKEETSMGLASIVEETCLSYQDTLCNLCYRHCPLKRKAITLDEELRPVIINEGCVGCGVCLYVCPTESKSITLKAEGRTL
jgi:ferredoxin-type protein NapG